MLLKYLSAFYTVMTIFFIFQLFSNAHNPNHSYITILLFLIAVCFFAMALIQDIKTCNKIENKERW